MKLSNSQLNKLKSATKNRTEVALRLLSNMIDNSDDKTNFPHKIDSIDKVNNSSTDIKLSKTQLSKMIQ